MKIPKGQSGSVYRRRTDNTMGKSEGTKGQTTIYKNIYKTKERVTRTPLKPAWRDSLLWNVWRYHRGNPVGYIDEERGIKQKEITTNNCRPNTTTAYIEHESQITYPTRPTNRDGLSNDCLIFWELYFFSTEYHLWACSRQV